MSKQHEAFNAGFEAAIKCAKQSACKANIKNAQEVIDYADLDELIWGANDMVRNIKPSWDSGFDAPARINVDKEFGGRIGGTSVNWSACGSQSIEDTREFANFLLEVCDIAENLEKQVTGKKVVYAKKSALKKSAYGSDWDAIVNSVVDNFKALNDDWAEYTDYSDSDLKDAEDEVVYNSYSYGDVIEAYTDQFDVLFDEEMVNNLLMNGDLSQSAIVNMFDERQYGGEEIYKDYIRQDLYEAVRECLYDDASQE